MKDAAPAKSGLRIAFVIPPSEALKLKFVSYQQPINLAYLAASARSAGAVPAIWDYGMEGFTEQDFLRKIKEFDPAIIGIHCKTFNILQGNYLAGIVKKNFPGIVTIVGGPHSSAMPSQTLDEFNNFDIVAAGEADETIRELCGSLASGTSIDDVKGLYIRKGSGIKITLARPLIRDLDSLEYPARDLFNKEMYGKFQCTRGLPYFNINATEIFTSRGCPGKCIFCAVNISYGNCVRFRSVANCLGEIEECIGRFGYNHIVIQDDSFTLKKERVREFLAGFRKLGLKSWSCDTRVDTVDEELLREMASSGCRKISFGVESGSEKVLKLIKKNITPSQVKRAVGWAKKAGVKIVECTFIVGSHPDETHDDVKASWNLIKELRPDILSVSSIVPYPGTEVCELMKQGGYLKEFKWNDFQMIGTKLSWRTKNFSSEEITRLQHQLINRYYFSATYIMKRLRKINNINEIRYWAKAAVDYLKFFSNRTK